MNDIPEDQWNERLAKLIASGLTIDTVKEAFTLHNDKFTPKETKTHCGGCTQRVWQRLNHYYNGQK